MRPARDVAQTPLRANLGKPAKFAPRLLVRRIRPLGAALDASRSASAPHEATLAVSVIEGIGGRTRTRTLDPLIKSQLLYQLSYAPGPLAVARGGRL
jgi:hypothetical protein